MTLNNVQLPTILIADLYKKDLVEDAASGNKKQIPDDKKPVQFLGKNLQHFTILVNYPNEVYLPEHHLEFLSNILKACQLNIGDVAIVNCYTQNINLKTLTPLEPKNIIAFGLQSPDPQLKTEEFNILSVNNINIANFPVLDMLNQNSQDGKILKSKLWNCLKQLLHI